MEIQVRPHLRSLVESATLAVNVRALQRRAGGEDVCHLGFGESPFPIHPKIASALAENTHRKEYLPSQGLEPLRRQVAAYLAKRNQDFGADQIFVGPGSKELIFDLISSLDGPLLIPTPSWVSYAPQALLAQKEVHLIPTDRENGYKISAAQLGDKAAALSGQKLLVINSPSNPTGAVYAEDEVIALVEVCRRHNVLVLSDEIYSEVYFGEHPPPSFSRFYPEGSFVTTGMSKVFSAGGWRLGLLGIPPKQEQLRRTLVAFISETFSAVSSPVQYAAMAAYGDDAEIEAHKGLCRRIHRACGLYLWKGLIDLGLNCPGPEGAFYLFADLENFRESLADAGIGDIRRLCRLLLERHNLAVLPGADFGRRADDLVFRAAFVDYDGAKVLQAAQEGGSPLDDHFVETHCPNLGRALGRMKDFLANLN